METMIQSQPKLQVPDRLYFRIGDVAELVGVKPYVLRYWESEFPMINPQKSSSGQRVYRRSDVETVLLIKHLLYEERYSIEGARKRIKELKRTGDLKTFKEGALALSDKASEVDAEVVFPLGAEAAPSSIPSQQLDHQQMRELVHEIKALTQLPISELFQY